MSETDEKGIITRDERDRIEAFLPPAAIQSDVIKAWLTAQRDATRQADIAVVKAVQNPWPKSGGTYGYGYHEIYEEVRRNILAALGAQVDG